MKTKVVWKNVDNVSHNMDRYGKAVIQTAENVAHYWAPKIEAEAKEAAPWTDQTGNARQGLFTVVERERDKVTLHLSHAMDYGVFLELRWAGRFAVILPTLMKFYKPVMHMLQRVLR